MSEPQEIHPFQLDGKNPDRPGDFRLKFVEEADPKGLSAPAPVVSSGSIQLELEIQEPSASAEKVITQPKAEENGLPTLPPVTSAGKTKLPAKT